MATTQEPPWEEWYLTLDEHIQLIDLAVRENLADMAGETSGRTDEERRAAIRRRYEESGGPRQPDGRPAPPKPTRMDRARRAAFGRSESEG